MEAKTMPKTKYLIESKYQRLSNAEQQRLKQVLIINGIKPSTFYHWMKITSESKSDIPHQKIEIIAQALNTTVEELRNYDVQLKTAVG